MALGVYNVTKLRTGKTQEGEGTGSCSTAGLSLQGLCAFASVLSHILDGAWPPLKSPQSIKGLDQPLILSALQSAWGPSVVLIIRGTQRSTWSWDPFIVLIISVVLNALHRSWTPQARFHITSMSLQDPSRLGNMFWSCRTQHCLLPLCYGRVWDLGTHSFLMSIFLLFRRHILAFLLILA
jgi:hypothetical protein